MASALRLGSTLASLSAGGGSKGCSVRYGSLISRTEDGRQATVEVEGGAVTAQVSTAVDIGAALGARVMMLVQDNIATVVAVMGDAGNSKTFSSVNDKADEALSKLANLTGVYVHIRYSKSADGSGMVERPDALTSYIGIVSDDSEEAPTDPSAYTWSLIRGADGVKGEAGADGKSNYLHVKWSDDGRTFTADSGEAVGDWMGTCVTPEEADPADFAMYAWVKVKGERGPQGLQGERGDTGATGKDGADGKMLLGICTTEAATAAKTVSIAGFSLYTGVTVAVRFQYANTAASPMLNVNSTGAKAICTNGVNAAYWKGTNATIVLTYDGTYWRVCSQPVYASTATVGNPSSGNVYIDSSGVSVRSGSTVLSSFGASTVKLGASSAASIVEMCGGTGQVSSSNGQVYVRGSKGAVLMATGDSDAGVGISGAAGGETAVMRAPKYEIGGVSLTHAQVEGRMAASWATFKPTWNMTLTKSDQNIPFTLVTSTGRGSTMFTAKNSGICCNFDGAVIVSAYMFVSMDHASSDNPDFTIKVGSTGITGAGILIPNAWGAGDASPLAVATVTNGTYIYMAAKNNTAAQGYVNPVTRLTVGRIL